MPTDTSYHGGLAAFFAGNGQGHPTNAYIDRPAMLALVGDIAGQDVLDVGCGPGYYTATFADRGATVTALDGSAELLEVAKRGGSYYEGGRVEAPVGGPGTGFSIDFERMTVERFVNEMLDGGFVLERLLEPRPSPEFRDVDAAKFEALDVKATVLTVALRRPE